MDYYYKYIKYKNKYLQLKNKSEYKTKYKLIQSNILNVVTQSGGRLYNIHDIYEINLCLFP